MTELEENIKSKVEFLEDPKGDKDWEMNNISIEVCDKYSFNLQFDIDRKTMKRIKNVSYEAIVYNESNHIKAMETIWDYGEWRDEHQGEAFSGHTSGSFCISLAIPLERIGKIRIIQEYYSLY